ncbi:hypothetical protein EDD27_1652 [Nonomuraea polychroma]|uniref:Uncharacterized protein n=2 Tax=Nonomuraea polychroma TaxID=46176 RepID=A0A438M0I8_9ACTN|nr:hypothetical protein EDD27_1652 [Nonomuraea polychroma]
MYAMPHGDDLDERFNELVAQIDAEERRRMRTAAKKGARTGRRSRSGRTPGHADRLSDGRTDHLAGPRPRIGRAWLTMATITALIAAAGVVVTLRPDLLTPSGAIPAETIPVAAAPLPEEPEKTAEEEPAGPFAGSPAEDWPEGVDGFVMPEAKALGGLSKKDVAKGLERTRELLAAAYLDRKTLLGGKPDAFAKLLADEQRDWFRDGLDDADASTRHLVNSFAPGTAELATDVIKVKGRVTLGTFKDGGVRGVTVKLNHLIVYAVHRPGQPQTTIRLVAHATGEVRLQRAPGLPFLWLERFGASPTPARCDVEDGYIHPVYRDSPPDESPVTGTPVDPYELDTPETDADCQAAQPT